jgi:AraC family transcriptional regulator, transcriptional activator of pobA
MEDSDKISSVNISHLKIEEKIGNILFNIAPGNFCTFDESTPTNGKHLHHCYELCIVTNGQGEFIHGNQVLPIIKGDVFLADPNVTHEITILKDKSSTAANTLKLFYFSIYIYKSSSQKSSSLEESLLNKFLDNHCIIRNSQDQLIAYLTFIYEYSNYKPSYDYGIRQGVKSVVLESLLSLTEGLESKKDDYSYFSNNIIDLAIDYIGGNLSSKIALDNIAAYCKTSKRNLQYLFSKYMQTSVVDYINSRRMSLASSYIRMNFRISDIGLKIGITDPAQFCRVFKKYYGVSPKKYQMAYSANGMVYGTRCDSL